MTHIHQHLKPGQNKYMQMQLAHKQFLAVSVSLAEQMYSELLKKDDLSEEETALLTDGF